jgi:RNA polymerase sigma factor (sigma-70 family)
MNTSLFARGNLQCRKREKVVNLGIQEVVSPPLEQRIENDSSFERMYRDHRRDVYGAVLREVRDPAEAEDVTQIAFLNAFRAMRRGERPEKPRAWLVTIARNVVRRRYRDLMRRPQEVGLDPEVAAALAEVDGPTAAEIGGAIKRLPPSQRMVILLREIQGRSYAEIAEELDLSVAAVETLIFRARRSLSEELELVDRVPTTQRRRRGLFFLPLPGLGKLSLGFSLGRAGAAALVGSVALVTVPMDSGADPVRPPAVQRGPSAAEAVGPIVTAPTAFPPAIKARQTAEKPRLGQEESSKAEPSADSGANSTDEPLAGLPAAELPTVEEAVPLPPLPVEPPALPEPPPLPPVPELPPLPLG